MRACYYLLNIVMTPNTIAQCNITINYDHTIRTYIDLLYMARCSQHSEGSLDWAYRREGRTDERSASWGWTP